MPLVVVALVVCAAGPIRDPLGPYLGKPVLSVDMDAPSGEQVDELVRLTGISPGYLVSTEAVESALERLYALGRFSSVDLYAERVSGVVALHFVLKRARHLAGLEVKGLSRVGRTELVSALHLPPGSEVDHRTPELVRERALAYLARVGLPRAEVRVTERATAEDAVRLEVGVREGEPRRVREVLFVGSPRVGSWVLRDLLKTRAGGVLDLDELERDHDRLVRAYVERGFARVRVDPPRVEGDLAWASVVFPVSAGPRVAIYFRGNQALSDAALRALLPSGTGPMQPGDLEIFARRITDAYRRLGYPHARCAVRGFRDQGGVERYVYTVEEGRPLAVDRIEFTGAHAFSPALLAAQVRAVLAQELTPDGAFEPLTTGELARAAGDRAPATPAEVAPEQRWIPELYERALDEVSAAYRDRGFLRVAVGPPRLEEDGDRGRVVIPVVEGPETHVRSLSFLDNAMLPSGELYDELLAAAHQRDRHDAGGRLPVPGSALSSAGVEDARIALVRRYRDEGYLYARIFSDVRLTPDGTGADVAYRFEEGPQVHIDNLLVRGNLHTSASLIRNHMSLREGGLYRLDQALEDQRDIAGLGVFSSVRVRLVDEEKPSERKDVVAEVVERNRQSIEVAPGISTADGPRLRIDYSHLNIAGTATSFTSTLKLNLKTFFAFYGEYAQMLADRYHQFNLGQKLEIQARAGVRSPRVITKPLETGVRVDLVGERDNAIPYSLNAGRVIFGIDMLAFDRLGLTFEPQFSLTSLRCFPNTAEDQSGDCQTEVMSSTRDRRRIDEGLRVELKLGPALTLDLRDDALNPRHGILATARAVYGVGSTLPADKLNESDFGLDTPDSDWKPFSYTRLEASISGYVPLGQAVLGLTLRGGTIVSGSVPFIDERFYLGGSSTMRGFQESAMFADDVCVVTRPDPPPSSLPGRCVWGNRDYAHTENGVLVLPLPKGGDHFVLFKTEARIPIARQFLLTLFTDVGNLWLSPVAWRDVRLRVNPGAGLRYATPAGPIGIDVGFTPDPDPLRGERLVNVQLAVGVF